MQIQYGNINMVNPTTIRFLTLYIVLWVVHTTKWRHPKFSISNGAHI
jgi:hypothetical protein